MQVKNILKNVNLTYIVVWFLIFIGVVLRLKVYIANQPFWLDECDVAENMISAGSNYLKLFKPLNMNQCAPPFFLIVSKFILEVSNQTGNIYNQDLILRAFPCFCSIASLFLFVIFVKNMVSERYLIWLSVAMLSFNTCAIDYAQQFKQYSCEMLFALVLLLIFQNIDIKEIQVKKLVLYVAIFMTSIWFSNTAIIILLSGYLYILFEIFKNKYFGKYKTKIFILTTPMIVDLTIYYFGYYKGVDAALHGFMYKFWSSTFPSFFSYNNFTTLFVQKMQRFIEFPYAKFLFLFLLVCMIILFKRKDIDIKNKYIITAPIFLCILMNFMNIYPFEPRLILFLLPLFILIYSQISFLLKQSKLISLVMIVVFLVLGIEKYTMSLENLLNDKYLARHYRRIAQVLIQNKVQANKIITTTRSKPNYYMKSIFLKEEPILADDLKAGFKKSSFPSKIKQLPKSDYWLYCPHYVFTSNYQKDIEKYIENDSHLKIIEKWEEPESKKILLMHFEKISEY